MSTNTQNQYNINKQTRSDKHIYTQKNILPHVAALIFIGYDGPWVHLGKYAKLHSDEKVSLWFIQSTVMIRKKNIQKDA